MLLLYKLFNICISLANNHPPFDPQKSRSVALLRFCLQSTLIASDPVVPTKTHSTLFFSITILFFRPRLNIAENILVNILGLDKGIQSRL